MYQYRVNVDGKERIVYRFPFELVDSNMYFIPSGETGIVIDPNENEELLRVFGLYGTKRVMIALTHEHYDHTTGVAWLQSKIATRLFCHKECAEVIATLKGNDPKTLGYILTLRDAVDSGSRRDDFMATAKKYVLYADETFEGESTFGVGDISLRCVSAPGHSPGSVLYFLGDNIVFTGDSLIQHTPTIVHLPRSDRKAFKQFTRPYLQSLDKNMMAYPGHGEPFRLKHSQFLYL